jgi:hypothetical protein
MQLTGGICPRAPQTRTGTPSGRCRRRFRVACSQLARLPGIRRPALASPVATSSDEGAAEELASPLPQSRASRGEFIDLLTYLFGEVLDGRNAHLTDGVQRALGREPKDFADFARDAAAAGTWKVRASARSAAVPTEPAAGVS